MQALSVGDQERAERMLKRSINKRTESYNLMTSILDLVKRVEQDRDVIPVLQARVKDIELVMTDFRLEQDEILNQLISLSRDSEYSSTHAAVGAQMVDNYYLIKASMTALGLDKIETSPITTYTNLPKIQIPTFDGDMLNWRSFRDTFMSLVHNNKQLSAVQKFHYLLSSVTGSAVSIVKSVPISDANYSIVWEALHSRFDNKRLLLNAHLDTLFRFNPLTNESLNGLKNFASTFQENVAAIKALEIDDLTGYLFFYIASRGLDSTTKRLFEFEYHDAEIPTLDMLLSFVQIRCQVLQNAPSSRVTGTKFTECEKRPYKHKSLVTSSHHNTTSCKLCKENHQLYQCTKFVQKPVKLRFKFARANQLCMNCLNSTHKTSECSSTYTCRYCSAKHHSLLHLNTTNTKITTNDNLNNDNNSSSPSDVITPPFSGTSHFANNVVLGTAIARIRDNTGQWVPVRLLIDTGSQISVITNTCVSKLGLKRYHCNTAITGLSETPVSKTKGSVKCSIVPLKSSEPVICCEPIILSNITGHMPSTLLPSAIRATYENIQLADPHFDVPAPIDFLMGADIYPQILGNTSKVLHAPGLPSAYETSLGWIILGQSTKNVSTTFKSLLLTSEQSVDQLLRKFWEVEEPILVNPIFSDDQKTENHFQRTTCRDETGRYSVSLPFRNKPSLLGNSRDMAVSRFYNLERKLMKDPVIYQEYRQFMQDYESLGHMKLATQSGAYHIPHHAVVKRDGNKVKLRVVFDASATSTTGKSLNDILHVGKKLQTDISDLILRSRLQKYIFTADICKMYRQIKINATDTQYQHIVWRNSPSDILRDYELTTVTYGITSSPFHAIRVLHQLENDDGHLYPVTNNILSTQTYVDDIITGHDTISGLLERQRGITKLLSRAGFELKKWSSNCPKLLSNIPLADQTAHLSFDPKDDISIKILGLHWDPNSDTFGYHTAVVPTTYTKRSVLSTIAKLYDPLGALGPVIFWAKCYMQLLWQRGLNWDDPLPVTLLDTWTQFSSELPLLSKIKVTRHIPCLHRQSVQLIGFSDASEKGYSAVVYLRITYLDGTISVYFITSKSKVAPLKRSGVQLTMPRLELCGTLLLAQTINRLAKSFKDINIDAIHSWTDSQVVLTWLTSPQSCFKIFVTNRLAKISELLPSCQWHYISTKHNPADCVSRGLFPSQINDHTLYWQGPSFLKLREKDWPKIYFEPLDTKLLPDYKDIPKVVLNAASEQHTEWFARFSSFDRLKRVTSIMYRFINKLRQQTIFTGPIGNSEQENAIKAIINNTQTVYFSNLFKELKSTTKTISPRSIASLAPFIDERGIICVGGRLRNVKAVLSRTSNPILLPKASTLTTLLIRHTHEKYFHAGPQLTWSLLSKRYWILSSRSVIRKVILSCVTCARHKATMLQPIMADLPSYRVNPSSPFLNVGIDFAGPMLIKEGKRKNARSVKCYLSIFICMAVKAVHIEVVSDLTTDSFLAALLRFTSRRGIPSDIYSDCGTNFKGADRQLGLMFRDSSTKQQCINAVQCKWHFNPPAAPHFGGLWEAAVKSTKYHIKRVVGNQLLTFEELTTLVARIEAVLNSRPLTAISADPNDLRPLTPADLLIGRALTDLPESDITTTSQNRLHRWQLVRQLHQSFWKRWSTEYITSLQNRRKWTKQQVNIKHGDLVIINLPNQPPTQWKMGRIESVHPGIDGIVRVVSVRTVDGIITRPVTKLAILPVE